MIAHSPSAHNTADLPTVPQLHFASPYERPHTVPSKAWKVLTGDAAELAVFCYTQNAYQQPSDLAMKPVLFLHGNQEEHGIFGPQIDACVAAGYQVYALDSRAQGKSSRGQEPELTYELFADDVLCVLDALDIQKVHIVGFSDGAIIGLLCARDYPSRVCSLVSIGANLSPEGVEDEWGTQEEIDTLKAWAAWGATLNTNDSQINPHLLTPTPAQAAQSAELLQLMLDHPHIDPQSLGAITCPVHVLAGEFDCIKPQETSLIGAQIADAHTTIFEETGHNLPKERPALLAELILAHLAYSQKK